MWRGLPFGEKKSQIIRYFSKGLPYHACKSLQTSGVIQTPEKSVTFLCATQSLSGGLQSNLGNPATGSCHNILGHTYITLGADGEFRLDNLASSLLLFLYTLVLTPPTPHPVIHPIHPIQSTFGTTVLHSSVNGFIFASNVLYEWISSYFCSFPNLQ